MADQLLRFDTRVIEELREFQEDGQPDLIEELYDLFTTHAPKILGALADCAEKSDFKGAARAAHSLKSASGNIGARKMMLLCAEVEQAAATKSIDTVRKLVELLQREYEFVQPAF